jgi:hypothetical protein
MLANFGFHAWLDANEDDAAVAEALDLAAAGRGLSLVEAIPRAAGSRKYQKIGVPPVVVSIETKGPWCQWALYPLEKEAFAAYGSNEIKAFLGDMCEATRVRLGRSFREGGFALVQERELTGQVDCLDWYQYFGPSLSEQFGRDVLAKGPFLEVERLKSGATAITMGASPFEEWVSIRTAAEYLGLSLRPMYTKDAQGNRIEIAWR